MECGVCLVALCVRTDSVRVYAGQPADAHRDGTPDDGRPSRSGHRRLRYLCGFDQPVDRLSGWPDGPKNPSAISDRRDAGLRTDRRLRAELCCVPDRPRATRRRHWWLLVNVDGDGDAAGAGEIGAEGAGHSQRWQCTRSDICGSARQLPWCAYRLARCVLHCGASRRCRPVLAIAEPANDAQRASGGRNERSPPSCSAPGRLRDGGNPLSLHGAVRALHLPAALSRDGDARRCVRPCRLSCS